jgi:Zn finger protein HypA/HybF involved in hydrogenase expression
MHEAGLARAVAETIHAEGLVGVPVRLLVTGGHAEPSAFDEAFRFHLSVVAPDLAPALVEILHRPAPQRCVGCGLDFEDVFQAPCPACGGVALPGMSHEELELEPVDEPAVTFGPPERDGGTAGTGTGDRETGPGDSAARGPSVRGAPPGRV